MFYSLRKKLASALKQLNRLGKAALIIALQVSSGALAKDESHRDITSDASTEPSTLYGLTTQPLCFKPEGALVAEYDIALQEFYGNEFHGSHYPISHDKMSNFGETETTEDELVACIKPYSRVTPLPIDQMALYFRLFKKQEGFSDQHLLRLRPLPEKCTKLLDTIPPRIELSTQKVKLDLTKHKKCLQFLANKGFSVTLTGTNNFELAYAEQALNGKVINLALHKKAYTFQFEFYSEITNLNIILKGPWQPVIAQTRIGVDLPKRIFSADGQLVTSPLSEQYKIDMPSTIFANNPGQFCFNFNIDIPVGSDDKPKVTFISQDHNSPYGKHEFPAMQLFMTYHKLESKKAWRSCSPLAAGNVLQVRVQLPYNNTKLSTVSTHNPCRDLNEVFSHLPTSIVSIPNADAFRVQLQFGDNCLAFLNRIDAMLYLQSGIPLGTKLNGKPNTNKRNLDARPIWTLANAEDQVNVYLSVPLYQSKDGSPLRIDISLLPKATPDNVLHQHKIFIEILPEPTLHTHFSITRRSFLLSRFHYKVVEYLTACTNGSVPHGFARANRVPAAVKLTSHLSCGNNQQGFFQRRRSEVIETTTIVAAINYQDYSIEMSIRQLDISNLKTTWRPSAKASAYPTISDERDLWDQLTDPDMLIVGGVSLMLLTLITYQLYRQTLPAPHVGAVAGVPLPAAPIGGGGAAAGPLPAAAVGGGGALFAPAAAGPLAAPGAAGNAFQRAQNRR